MEGVGPAIIQPGEVGMSFPGNVEVKMCLCIEEVNKHLKDHNTEIVMSLTDPIGDAIWLPMLKVKPLKKGKTVDMFCSHCPFCGIKYE